MSTSDGSVKRALVVRAEPPSTDDVAAGEPDRPCRRAAGRCRGRRSSSRPRASAGTGRGCSRASIRRWRPSADRAVRRAAGSGDVVGSAGTGRIRRRRSAAGKAATDDRGGTGDAHPSSLGAPGDCAQYLAGFGVSWRRPHGGRLGDDRTRTGDRLRLKSTAGRGVLLAASSRSGMAFLDGTVVNVALPHIGADLDADVAGLQWTVNGYLLTLAAFVLLGGALGDRFGRRADLPARRGLVHRRPRCCAGSRRTSSSLIGARFLQGAGSALLTPGSLALIQASFHPDDRGRAIGAWSGLAGVSTALGPFLGGWLIDSLSWRWIFFINVPLAAARGAGHPAAGCRRAGTSAPGPRAGSTDAVRRRRRAARRARARPASRTP